MGARDLWIFGYGSLVSPESVERTLGRTVTEFGKATLRGFRRGWNATMENIHDDPTDKYFVDENGHRFSGTATALGVYRSRGSWVNGSIFSVTPDDLHGFDSRERRYDRVDISALMTGPVKGSIVTYVPKSSAVRRGEVSRLAGTDFVSAQYVRLVEQAFVDLGGNEIGLYRGSTDQIEAKIIEMTTVLPRE